jgi:hypothetical protein
VTAEILRPAQFDTPTDQEVSISLDVGAIPFGYPGAGRFVVTVQAHPLPDRKSADILAKAMLEALNSRLGIRMKAQQ